jgi:hypothetical protein
VNLLALHGHLNGWNIGFTDNILLETFIFLELRDVILYHQPIVKVCIIDVFVQFDKPIILRLADRYLVVEFRRQRRHLEIIAFDDRLNAREILHT